MGKHHGGSYYIGLAERNDLRVVNGKGDHYKIYGEIDGEKTMMVVPVHRELADGTECTIRKWFMRLGILVVLSFGCMAAYLMSTVGGW